MFNVFGIFSGRSNPESKLNKLIEKLFEENFSAKATIKILKFLLKNKNFSQKLTRQGNGYYFLYDALLIGTWWECGNDRIQGNYERFDFSVEGLRAEIEAKIVYFIPEINYSSTSKPEVFFIRNMVKKRKLPLRIGDLILLLYNKVSEKN